MVARHTLTVKASGGSSPPLATNFNIMQKFNWSKEELENAIKNNYCYSDVLRELQISTRGRNIDTLKKKIVDYNLDISHFTFVSKNKGQNCYKSVQQYLVENSNIKTHDLKEKLFKEKIKENKCELCGITEWLGKPIVCQLHHINGNHKDNRLENLQILCPNCHSQTDTYSGSANKNNKIKRICIDCGRELHHSKAVRCVLCAAKNRRTVSEDKMPTKEELLKMIQEKPFTEIGKMYNVSDNTIRKWCKRYDIPTTKYALGLREQGVIPNKICPNCSKEYHPKDRKQVCCGRDCQIEYAKYKDILDNNGNPIVLKDDFISYAQTHSKQETYKHFNITRYKYKALEYYFLNKK